VTSAAPGVTDTVRRAREGDERAFETLYHEHAGRVYALCLRLAGDSSAARELTQDVFVRAWEKLDTFRGESAFSSWLHRLALNVVMMSFRTDSRRREVLLDDPELPETAAPRRDPEERLDLEKLIASLPTGARTVLVLHDIEGYEHREIARMLGIAEGTSKAHLFRGRRLLREALER
jgi:RNA polymerase sigma-70 factor (ECF subfamily)